jgi:hypothetical protein
MRRCFLCLFLVFGFISLNGQAVLTEVKSIAKDLGENLGKGFYQKSWKKNKDTWLTNLANASDEKTVHAMVTTLADNISEKAYNNTPLLQSEASLIVACKNLISICENAKPEFQCKGYLEKLNNALQGAKENSLRNKMKPFLKDIEENFAALIEDSRKDGFEATRKGNVKKEGKLSYFETNVTIGGIQAVVAIGPEENQRFRVIFNCYGMKQAALDLCKSLEPILNIGVPNTYKKSRDFSPEYAGSIYANVWEYVSEEFIEIAKKPTVSVGVLKENGNFLVDIKIMEPVFKR